MGLGTSIHLLVVEITGKGTYTRSGDDVENVPLSSTLFIQTCIDNLYPKCATLLHPITKPT